MAGDVFPFAIGLATVTRTVNTGSQSVALGTVGATSQSTPTPQGYPTYPGGFSVRVANVGTEVTWIAFGYGSAATADTASSMPMLGGTVEVFTVGPGCTHISAIVAQNTATIYATTGQGI